MTLSARHAPRGRPQLTVVRGTRAPLASEPAHDWRRVAQAVNACTLELAQHLTEQRWGRVDEASRERRELLAWLARLPLDAHGRCCLRALTQAVQESDAAIASMMGTRG